jgi:hypothetical protein
VWLRAHHHAPARYHRLTVCTTLACVMPKVQPAGISRTFVTPPVPHLGTRRYRVKYLQYITAGPSHASTITNFPFPCQRCVTSSCEQIAGHPMSAQLQLCVYIVLTTADTPGVPSPLTHCRQLSQTLTGRRRSADTEVSDSLE